MKDEKDNRTLDVEPMIFGLDPSLSQTALVSAEKVKLFSSPPIEGPATVHARVERVQMLACEIADEVLKQKARALIAPIVFIEQYAFGARGGSVHGMIEAAFEIRRQLLLAGARVVEVPVSVLKKFMTGKGNANKVQMAVAAAKIGWEVQNDDEADGVALYVFGMAVEGRIPVGAKRKLIVEAFRKTPEFRRANGLPWEAEWHAKKEAKKEARAKKAARRK